MRGARVNGGVALEAKDIVADSENSRQGSNIADTRKTGVPAKMKCVPATNVLALDADHMPVAPFSDWTAVQEARAKLPSDAQCVAFSAEELSTFLGAASAKQIALVKSAWTATSPNPSEVAFAAKVAFPAGSKVAIFGDIHGEFATLLHELQVIRGKNGMDNRLRMAEHSAAIFCGDLLDRGAHAIEVFALVVLLRLANPTRVFIARGNHEGSGKEQTLTLWENYGLLGMNEAYANQGELQSQFGLAAEGAWRDPLVARIYDATLTLPVAIFFSVAGDSDAARWALASHGGFEPSSSVKAFLGVPIPAGHIAAYAAFGAPRGPGAFLRHTWNSRVYTTSGTAKNGLHVAGADILGPDIVGEYKWKYQRGNPVQYQWADVAENERTPFFDGSACLKSGRCLLGHLLILEWMRANDVVSLFRGHQHSGQTLVNANR